MPWPEPVNGDVYVVDATECTISVIAGGRVSLVAGVAGTCGDTGDGGPTTEAQIQASKPYIASDGSLYLLQGAVGIRHVTADGVIHAVPYTNPTGNTNPGIATFAVAGDGRVYLGTSSGIFRGDPDGTTVTIVGNGSADPETTRYWGMGTDQPVSVDGAALTRNGGLVFTSGHVVYRSADPADAAAPTTTTTVP